MSSQAVTLRNLVDTFTNTLAQSRNYVDSKKLGLDSGEAYAFLHANRPFPLGSTIVSATLRLYTVGSWGVTPTLTAKRADAAWKASKVTWADMPGVVGAGATVSHSSAADHDEFAFDVTSIMQTVSNGGVWYGFRIETNNTTLRYVYSADAVDYRPTLDITWADVPQAPSTLAPSGGRAVSIAKPVLRFDFTDEVGSTALAAVRVQINATNVWTDPTFDSGPVTATEPELDLSVFTYARTVSVTKTSGTPNLTGITAGTMATADIGAAITGTGIPGSTTVTAATIGGTTATMSANASSSGAITATVTRTHPGLVNGTAYYWRAQVQDGAGLWSAWSDAAQMRRDNKGTLTITNPAVAPNDFVTEWTPPLSWSLASETQTSYQVQVTETDDRTVVRYDSGRVKGTATSLTLPKGIIVDGRTYQLVVRIWDSKDRESTPGDRAYTETTRDFDFNEDATVSPVTAFTATAITGTPYVNLNFTSTTAPDTFNLVRDGEVVDNLIVPADVLVSGTSYKIVDRDAKPRVSHTWKVQRVVGAKSSASNPTAALTPVPEGVWIYDSERSLDLYVSASARSTFDAVEVGATYTPVASAKPVRITQSVGGQQGVIAGVLRAGGSQTAAYWVAKATSIRNRPGRTVTLTYGDEAYPVVLFNIKITQNDDGVAVDEKNFYAEFVQVGKLPEVKL